jgi:hypothetical protein
MEKLFLNWSLRYNLNFLENFIERIETLSILLHKDWEQFMTTFCKTLKRILGAWHITLFFNDIEEMPKEGKRPKMIPKKVSMGRLIETTTLNETDKKILKMYDKDFLQDLHIPHINLDLGEIILSGKMSNCKILCMAYIYDFTPLQKSMLKGVFKALSQSF